MSPAQQRAVALSVANNIRSCRASAKREIRMLDRASARVRVAEIIENPGSEFRSIRLGELLCCVRQVAHGHAGALLQQHGLHMDVRLRELKVRERIALGEHLRSERGLPNARTAVAG